MPATSARPFTNKEYVMLISRKKEIRNDLSTTRAQNFAQFQEKLCFSFSSVMAGRLLNKLCLKVS
jgi:hypothetical protein